MRPPLLVALLLLCASSPFLSPLLAQTPDQSASDAQVIAPSAPQIKLLKPPPATAVITGTVFCNDTRRPARGAIVVAQPIPKDGHDESELNGNTSRVGMDGTYAIRHLSPGDYTIIALLPGYISPYDDLSVDGAVNNSAARARFISNGVVSARNDQASRLDITIQRGATISGRILYDDGAPATQVVLDLENVNAKPAAKKAVEPGDDEPVISEASAGSMVRGMFLHQSQGTDDQGNFRISGIKPGTYRIFAMPPLPTDSGNFFALLLGGFAQPGSLRIYSGDTFHKKAAKTYNLRAGDDVRDIEITIPVYAFHRVQGHITTVDDRPIVSAAISLTDTSDDSFVLHAQPARDGEFIFPTVPAGTYNLAVIGAKSGTVPDDYADNYPVAQIPLQNAQSFFGKTTTVLVKDDDVTDLNIHLQNAPPTPNQPPAAPPTPVDSSDPD